jgi:hypothetical protein
MFVELVMHTDGLNRQEVEDVGQRVMSAWRDVVVELLDGGGGLYRLRLSGQYDLVTSGFRAASLVILEKYPHCLAKF